MDAALVLRNWYIGKRINEEALKGADRAKYGAQVIANLSKDLERIYGKGYSKRVLYQCLRVYRMFPQIVNELRAQFRTQGKMNEYSAQSGILSWTHYRILTQVEDPKARDWYAKEAYSQMRSSNTVQRNVSSQYYYRLLKSQAKLGIEAEMNQLTSLYQNRLEFIKNSVIAEFLDMQEDISYYESEILLTICRST